MGQKVLEALLGVGKTLLPWIIDRVIAGEDPVSIAKTHEKALKQIQANREDIDRRIAEKFPSD